MIATILRAYLALGCAAAGVSYLVGYDTDREPSAIETMLRVLLWPVLVACLILDAPAIARDLVTRVRVWRLLRRGRAEVERAARAHRRRMRPFAPRGER